MKVTVLCLENKAEIKAREEDVQLAHVHIPKVYSEGTFHFRIRDLMSFELVEDRKGMPPYNKIIVALINNYIYEIKYSKEVYDKFKYEIEEHS